MRRFFYHIFTKITDTKFSISYRRNFMMENFNQEDREKKDRQLQNLENLVENHTRTQRHLEQYSEIGDKANKENARKIQKIREEQIQELESQLKDEEKYISPEEHLENVKENYYATKEYINHYGKNINEQMLQNLVEKQQHREEQINFLENEE